MRSVTPASMGHSRLALILASLLFLLLASILLALALGSTPLAESWLWGKRSARDAIILWDIRLPRILLALFVGMALSLAGATFQALLRNPLADPYNLGVSGGAALGNVIALSLGASFPVASASAFVTAVLTMLTIYSLSRTYGKLSNATLLLSGVIFNAFAISVIMIMFNFLAPQDSRNILFLLIGSLDAENWTTVAVVGGSVLIGFFALWRMAYPLNLLLLGEDVAMSLGLPVESYRRALFFLTSFMIGAAVSVSGLIGFVGLCIPHITRLCFGSDHRVLLPASGLLGASFLILADTLARTLLSTSSFQTELPVGVITTLVGAPFFIFLLKRSRHAL